ncbi:MAG TPA: hypothetical protein VF810_00510 [Patescibacteria group bacterium]
MPCFGVKPYAYAFLVHPRDLSDIHRKYPFFKYLPNWINLFFTRFSWPLVASKIEGLKSVKTGKEIEGYIIGITLTPEQMLKNRKLAVKKIRQASKLAEKMGCQIIGLGALLSSVTAGGLDLIEDSGVNITTGHALTAYIVTSNVFEFEKRFDLNVENLKVAVVGATGSIGSTSAQVLARNGHSYFVLIDLERKKHLMPDIVQKIKDLNPTAKIEISHSVQDIKTADIIITATNAPEALIRSEFVKAGAIIVDDAQPSDVSAEVLERNDVIVVGGGVIHTPGIKNNFNFGLKDKEDNFSCMGETMALAAHEWNSHFVIHRADLEKIDMISDMAKKIGFHLGKFQNAKEVISDEKIEFFRNLIKKEHVHAGY